MRPLSLLCLVSRGPAAALAGLSQSLAPAGGRYA